MRILTLARPVLIFATLAALALAARFAIATPRQSRESPPAIEPSPDPTAPPRADPDSIARITTARDPFRATRTPATVRFESRTADQPSAPPPQGPPRPTFVLVGILTGAEPAALVDGVPGSESTRVLRAGDRFGAYLLRSIGTSVVVIAGPDTTWTLRLRQRS